MVTQEERAAFSRRLNEALDDFQVAPKFQGRQLVVARMFGVSQHGARKWLEGEAIPGSARIPEIARKLGVTAEWLRAGNGPKYLTREVEKLVDLSELDPQAGAEVERLVSDLKSGNLSQDRFEAMMRLLYK